MLFVRSGKEYSAILSGGRVIKFEDEREARGVQAEYDEIMVILGKRLPESDGEVVMEICEPQPKRSRAEIKARKIARAKKKVRISVDTDTEYFCITHKEPAKKKALA
jgi:hypothetical protein